jgi:hypothetical protein
MPISLRLVFIFLAVAGGLFGADARPRVLIIDGINNHDWQTATTWMREFLMASEKFEVDVSTTPPREAPAEAWAHWRPDFARYAVVVSNFNGNHKPDGVRWPRDVEQAFEKYVRDGGGFVSWHAANNAFLGWSAYEEMVGLLWRDKSFGPALIVDEHEKLVVVPTGEGRASGHPPRYTFQMSVLNSDHPITRGMPKHWMHPSEQLSHGQRGHDDVVRSGDLTVLTYAWSESIQEREPMDWVRTYGKGRVYVTMLGHTWKDAKDLAADRENLNLRCAGLQTLFLRGVEWAATGKVTTPIPKDFPTAENVSVRAK